MQAMQHQQSRSMQAEGRGGPVRLRPKVPVEERKRVSRACRVCRLRKSRCIPTTGSGGSGGERCWRCVRNKLVCVFDVTGDGAGTPRGDEFSPLATGKESSPAESYTPEVFLSPHDVNDNMTDIDTGNEHRVPESQALPYSIRDSNQADHVGSGIPDLVVENLSPGDSEGTSARGDFLSRVRQAMFLDPAQGSSDSGSLLPNEYPQSSTFDLSDPRDIQEAVRCFPPREVAEFLVSTFFDYAVDSFFYLHQPWFMRSFKNFYTNSRSNQLPDIRFICIALLVFAIGSQFAHFKSRGKKVTATTPEPHSKQQNPGLQFYKHARRLFPDIMAKYSLEAVQVALLMAIFELPSSARDLAYFSVGQALRIAVSNEFHRKTSVNGGNREILEIRNRLWWSVYSLERSISIKMGRPEAIREEDIDAPMPSPLASLDDNQAHSNIHQQIAYANLTIILNRVVQQVSSAFISQNPQAISALETLKLDLKSWRSNLPPQLQLENLNPKIYGFRSVIHLHQNYHHAWIMMCRIPLLILVREKLKRSFTSTSQLASIAQTSSAPINKTISKMATTCSKAARKMIRLFEILRENDYLARFSFTDFHGCSIATIIILLHGILERDLSYKATISFAIDSLNFMATESGSETARLGVRFVVGFRALADEAVEGMEKLKRKGERGGDVYGVDEIVEAGDRAEKGYEMWVEWAGKEGGASLQTHDPNVLQPQSQPQLPPILTSTTSGVEAAAASSTGPYFSEAEIDANISNSDLNTSSFDPVVPSLLNNQQEQQSQQEEEGQDYYMQDTIAADTTSGDLFGSTMFNFDDSFILGFTGLDVLNIGSFDG